MFGLMTYRSGLNDSNITNEQTLSLPDGWVATQYETP